MLGRNQIEALRRYPEREIEGRHGAVALRARIAIPHYDARIANHYDDIAGAGLAAACARSEIPFALPHFGLQVAFERPVELDIHDADLRLDEGVAALVAAFGPVTLRNAYLPPGLRAAGHRNLFPHLRFHVDRAPAQANRYSCFTRDPTDPEQCRPRRSSTLFVANVVAWLQTVREGGCDPGVERGVRASYDLFAGTAMAELFGAVVLEQPWDAPEGTGEIAIIDNRTVQHASSYKDGTTKGYPIGTRYLF